MKTWSERLKQTLLCGHEVLACMDHEDLVRDAFYSDNDLSDETITRLDEVMRCDACRLVVAIVTGDLAWLESQPSAASTGSTDGNLHAAITKTLVEPHSLDDRKVIDPQQSSMEDGSRPQVPVLRVIVPEAGHDVDQLGFPFVKTLTFVSTSRVETRIRNAQTAVEVTNIFAPEVKDRDMNPGDATCLTGVLHSRQGNARLPSFAVDEFCYIHLGGRMVLEFEGAEPVTFDANDEVQVLWLPGTRNGTPPASVVCETEWVAGLVVFMREAGLHWIGPDMNDCVFLEDMDPESCSREHVSEYWRSVAARFPRQINEQRPFVGGIPLSEALLSAESRRLSMSIPRNKDPHWEARNAGDFYYASIPAWQTDASSSSARRRPIFDFRLLRFPGEASTKEKREVDLAKHPNGYEILIPLVGEFRCIGGEVDPEELSEHDMLAFRPMDESIDLDRFTERRVQAPAMSGRCLPNYVAICSDAVFHGFTALGGCDAYALHVRVGRAIIPRVNKRDERRGTGTQRHVTGGDR